MSEVQEKAISFVGGIQTFDPNSLVRRKELGDRFAFADVVEPARRLIDLFNQIPTDLLADLPDQQASPIAQYAESISNLFREILEFDPAIDNPTQERDNLVEKIKNAYPNVFTQLYPHLAYLGSRRIDSTAIENEARRALQQANETAEALASELERRKKEADGILEQVKAVAAEQGVSQQAIYFSNEADKHRDAASEWLKYTIISGVIVVLYSIFSLFFHNFEWLNTTTYLQGIQVVTSKVLIFAVLAYFTFLSAKNYLSHRHNEIVNRHRQNALTTFTALAEATSDAASADVVLSHAAACIFSPQDTGLTKPDSNGSDGVPNFQIIPRIGAASSG